MVPVIVLLLTRMSKHGFCITLAATNVAGEHVQIRPRWDDNNALCFHHFGLHGTHILRTWVPGRILQVAGWNYFPEAQRRITHPEDVQLTSVRVTPIPVREGQELYTSGEMAQIVAPFTHTSLRALYPYYQTQRTNNKGYLLGLEPQPRSTGFVNGCTASFFQEPGKEGYFARVTDASRNQMVCAVKDEQLLPRLRRGEIPLHQPRHNLLLGFSLSDRVEIPLDGNIPPTAVRQTCYVLLCSVVNWQPGT